MQLFIAKQTNKRLIFWYIALNIILKFKFLIKEEKKQRAMFLYSDHYHLLSEKAMAPHSTTPAWKIPWTEESGGLQSMGLLRVGHD